MEIFTLSFFSTLFHSPMKALTMYCSRNRKHVHCTVFLSSYRNRRGDLGEREMLWEQKATGECFHSFLEFSQTFTIVSISS